MRIALFMAAVFLALSSALPATVATPHAEAASLLRKCVGAFRGVPIVAIPPDTPAVPRANQRAAKVVQACNISPTINDLVFKHPKDKALQDAYSAAGQLQLGIGDYAQYLVAVAFDRRDQAQLNRAKREVAAGKRLAPIALHELG